MSILAKKIFRESILVQYFNYRFFKNKFITRIFQQSNTIVINANIMKSTWSSKLNVVLQFFPPSAFLVAQTYGRTGRACNNQ